MENNSIDVKMKGETEYYLGIDGGGTKTDFALADKRGNILARKVLGGCNPNDIGFNKALMILREGIECVTDAFNVSYDKISIYAGLAGCSSDENLPRISAFLSEFGFGRYNNHNDAQNAVAAGLGVCDGVAVIMGTGSIAYAKKGSDLYRIGGYGYLFGDAGSGFAIGRDVILAALQMEDGMGCPTVLYDMVRERCGGETVLSKIDLFYEKGKTEIASYAPLAFEAYNLQDKVAVSIIHKNLTSVAEMIRSGAARVGTEEIKAVLLGGLTCRGDIIIPYLYSLLDGDNKSYYISVCQKPPVVGALYLAGMKSNL